MHFTAVLTTSAGLAKYALPVSDIGCRGSHRAMIASILLYDVSEIHRRRQSEFTTVDITRLRQSSL